MGETWHRIEDWGKAHPVALGALIFVIGALLLYMFWPSSSAQPAQAGPSDAYYNAVAAMAQSGNQLQIAQLGAQVQSNQIQADLSAANTATAGQVSIATINGQTAVATAQIQADAQSAHDASVQQSTDLATTVGAQVATAGFATQQNIALINSTAATAQAKINADASVQNTFTNAQVQESSFAAQVQTAGIQATRDVQVAGIQGATAVGVAQQQTAQVQATDYANEYASLADLNKAQLFTSLAPIASQVSGGGYSFTHQ